MANNLFISYDLIKNRNYQAVHEKIKSLGAWAHVHESFWYVSSFYSAEQAFNTVHQACDGDDKLVVVDVTNRSVIWGELSKNVSDFIKHQWNL